MRLKLEDIPLLEGKERREIKDNAKINSAPATTMDNYRWIWTDMALHKLPYLNQINAVESLIIQHRKSSHGYLSPMLDETLLRWCLIESDANRCPSSASWRQKAQTWV